MVPSLAKLALAVGGGLRLVSAPFCHFPHEFNWLIDCGIGGRRGEMVGTMMLGGPARPNPNE